MLWERPELATRNPNFSMSDMGRINFLLQQLSPGAVEVCSEDIRIISNQSNFLIVREATKSGNNGTIIGIATLTIYRKPTGLVGIIDDVVVDSKFHGLGIGRGMIKILIQHAVTENVKHIDLTSKPGRKEANNLYLSLNFKRRRTNVYRLLIAP